MPYVGHLPIHKGTHIKNSLQYISKDEKAYEVTGINCSKDLDDAMALFEYANEMKGNNAKVKNGNAIIGHHYYQSFLPGTTNAEEAHDIGVELTKIIAPGYMAHIATHIDKEHIHNHIIICSVHPETGYKYRHCWDQFKFVNEQSDALCLERRISIINNPKKRDLSRKEYRTIAKGGSWKDKLTWDIDDAIDNAVANNSGKKGFIDCLESKGYIVNWQNKNIAIKFPDHKAVRVDTLAKTFGERYKKANIESRLKGEALTIERESISEKEQLPKHMKYGDTTRFNEYDRYIDWCMKKNKEVMLGTIKKKPPQLAFYQNKDKEQEKKIDSSMEYPKIPPKVKVHNTEREKMREKARSWKDVLAWNIDDAIDSAVANNSGKEGFIDYLKSKGYVVKYQNKNISIQIPGRKAIRVDTLAKTHGNQYTKENIEGKLQGEVAPERIEEKVLDHKVNVEKKNKGGTLRAISLPGPVKTIDKNKYNKTKDEREIEKEMEDLGIIIGRIIRKKKHKIRTKKSDFIR